MDIIGFNEQIGAFMDFMPKVKMPTMKTMVPMVKKPLPTSNFLKTATTLAKAKVNTALNNAKQTGKSVIVKTPFGAKKFTPKANTPFNLVPTAKSIKPVSNIKPKALKNAMPMAPVKNEVKQFEQTLQTMEPAKQAQAIFSAPVTPQLVQELNPVQRSFLKTDLPYKVLSKNNYGQPTTKVLKNTPLKFNIDIDQIQPAVDSGIIDYYGK